MAISQIGVAGPMVANNRRSKPSSGERIRDQHRSIAEASENARHRHLQTHCCNRLRHHHQTGLNRSKSEAHLIKQRKQEWNASESNASEEAAALQPHETSEYETRSGTTMEMGVFDPCKA